MSSIFSFFNQILRPTSKRPEQKQLFYIPTGPLVHLFSSTYHSDPTPLHDAVIKGFQGEVASLLSDPNCDIHARYCGKTALQYALDQQSAAIVELLLYYGAQLSPDDITYYENSDLRWAYDQTWSRRILRTIQPKRPTLTDADISQVASSLADQFTRFGLTEPDIIHDIMNMAEFWSLLWCVREEIVEVDHYTMPEPYIMSAPIRGQGHHPVQRIVFKIYSHDQGWGGENFPELYTGSWTWFEATSSSNPRPIEVQRNVAVSSTWRTHVVIWDQHSPPHIIEWLASLKSGDTVSLYAKALYDGWVNHVAYAEMYVYTRSV